MQVTFPAIAGNVVMTDFVNGKVESFWFMPRTGTLCFVYICQSFFTIEWY